jgi:hypothetical protein
MPHWLAGTKPETQATTDDTLNTLSREVGGADLNFIAKIRAKDPVAWDNHRALARANRKKWRDSPLGQATIAARNKRLADGV